MVERADSQAEALRQLTALNRIARIAVQDLEWRPMLQRIVDTLVAEFGWEFVACATVDRERNEFVCDAVCGAGGEVSTGYRRALGTGVVGRCAASGETIEIDDARAHPDVIDTLGGTGSELCVPVLHNGEVLAVLNAESRRVGAFRGQRPLLETVADQIAGILRAASLYEQLQAANGRLQEANAELERLSRRDGLTGVANRRTFDAWMSEAWCRAVDAGGPLALLMIDIDHFKRYNDSLGHPAGDACLREVAQLLQDMVAGSEARVARYGGEEFAIVQADLPGDAAAALAERLRRALEARDLPHPGAPGRRVTISVGVAVTAPSPGRVLATLVANADAALYEAKRQGRNCVKLSAA